MNQTAPTRIEPNRTKVIETFSMHSQLTAIHMVDGFHRLLSIVRCSLSINIYTSTYFPFNDMILFNWSYSISWPDSTLNIHTSQNGKVIMWNINRIDKHIQCYHLVLNESMRITVVRINALRTLPIPEWNDNNR